MRQSDGQIDAMAEHARDAAGNVPDNAEMPVLIIAEYGPGRTLAYEASDPDGENTDAMWQAVESGDLDGYYDWDGETVCPCGHIFRFNEHACPECGTDKDAAYTTSCICGKGYRDGQEHCDGCGAPLADAIHPKCFTCGAIIYTNDGAWYSPFDNYYCAECVEIQ